MSANALSAWRHPDTGHAIQWLKDAVSLAKDGRLDAAIHPLEKYIKFKPDHFEAIHLRAEILLKKDDFDGAIKGFTHAIQLKPLNGLPYYNLAQTLQKKGSNKEAIRLYNMALELKFEPSITLNGMGIALRESKKTDEAMSVFNQLITQHPDYLPGYINRCTVFLRQHQLKKAIADCDTALGINENYLDAWYNRGFCFGELLDYQEAHHCYHQVLLRDPDNKKVMFAMALIKLALGDYANGWKEYEVRFDDTSLGLKKPAIQHDVWDGKTPLCSKRVAVYIEQGLGDILQFCRFVPRLADMGAEVWLIAPQSLTRLLESLDSRIHITTGEISAPDYAIMLMSLPYLLGINEESEFGRAGYLSAPSGLVTWWQQQLGGNGRVRIGLAWSGNSTHKNDHERSLALADLLAVLPPHLDYVVVQKDIRADDAALLASQSSHRIAQPEKQDFADTAALCASLDLVISVDTSVAHLAGAVGCPLWVLLPHNPDWRWLLGRDDSPWYAGARLWRQPAHGDWQRPLQALAQALLQAYPELQPAVLPTGH